MRERLIPTRHLRHAGVLVFVAVALAGSAASERPAHTRDWALLQVAFGHTGRFELGDGRRAYLNTNSTIHLLRMPGVTVVAVGGGETYFDGDGTQPLSVLANGATLRTAGNARFSVRVRDAGRTDVLVAAGSVEIGRTGRQSGGWLAAALPFAADSVRLEAGEAASVDAQGLYAKRTIAADTLTHKLAWKDGWLWFGNEPLSEALERFNSYNIKQLVLADPRLYALRVGGRFHPTEPESFIASLRLVFGVRATAGVPPSSDSNSVYLRGGCAGKLRRCDTAMVQ